MTIPTSMVDVHIYANGHDIPVLMPSPRIRSIARQIGLPEHELFTVDNPAGMSRYLSAKVLIANDQLQYLYGDNPNSVTLTLRASEDSNLTVTFENLTPLPAQPVYWSQQGGVALVELVDQRYSWQFSTSAGIREELWLALSSDGRVFVNENVLHADALLDKIRQCAASYFSLVNGAPYGSLGSNEFGGTTNLVDLLGSCNVSLPVIIDALAVACQKVVCKFGPKEHDIRFVDRGSLGGNSLLKDYYYWMNSTQRAVSGGMQATLGVTGLSDPVVDQWAEYGFKFRCPEKSWVINPQRFVEGQTLYNNIDLGTSAGLSQQVNFVIDNQRAQHVTSGTVHTGKLPGNLIVSSSEPFAIDIVNGVRSNPFNAINPNPDVYTQYNSDNVANRYQFVPFGRTMWAGWLQPKLTSPYITLGQIGMVSYRLAEVDGRIAPFMITSADPDDWIFGSPGKGHMDPKSLISVKGKGQAYTNVYGNTIIDVPPPTTRTFMAKIVASTMIEPWKWRYTFQEVQQNSTVQCAKPVAVGNQRSTLTDGYAVNACENYNQFVSAGHANNRIAPGIKQSDYTAGQIIEALPIQGDTVVEMVEQINDQVWPIPPLVPVPQFWFSMPNAVKVTCGS